jgi:hypothetical protein
MLDAAALIDRDNAFRRQRAAAERAIQGAALRLLALRMPQPPPPREPIPDPRFQARQAEALRQLTALQAQAKVAGCREAR